MGERKPFTRKINGIDVTRFQQVWSDMKRRCDNPNRPEYKNYGARGITYDKSWSSFMNFYNDMYSSYIEHSSVFTEKDTTLDRIDVNLNYTKENCKWATMRVQQNNRRNNFLVEYSGKTYKLDELSGLCGVPIETLRWRYKKGLREDDLIKPLKAKNKKKSGIKNIIWDKRLEKWLVLVSIGNGKQKRLGSFNDINSAKDVLENYKRGELIV